MERVHQSETRDYNELDDVEIVDPIYTINYMLMDSEYDRCDGDISSHTSFNSVITASSVASYNSTTETTESTEAASITFQEQYNHDEQIKQKQQRKEMGIVTKPIKKKEEDDDDDKMIDKRQQQRKINSTKRKKMMVNSNVDETCLIGCMALYHNVTIRRSTRKNDDHIERFIIENIDNAQIQSHVNVVLSQYLLALGEKARELEQRSIDKTYQSIYFNTIIDYLKQAGNVITEYTTKECCITIKRRRFKTINGRSQDECRTFGEALNKHLQSLIPVTVSKKDGLLTLTKDHIIPILQQYPLCFPSSTIN